MLQYQLGEIADYLGLEVQGDRALQINSIAPLDLAGTGQISFVASEKMADTLQNNKASALIVKPGDYDLSDIALLFSDNPYLAFARLSALFDDVPKPQAGIAASAVLHETARIGRNVSIAPGVVVGAHCVIGDDSIIEANTVISDRCVLGKACRLRANVTLYHNSVLGDRVSIHSGTVIGSDGFGYAPSSAERKWQKIHQLGGVRIGNDVEIGANTCIDRGALADTIIHDGVIIDNQVHIAHNCEIGENTAVAGCVGMAGSVTIGKNCTFAGAVAINGHITIVDDVHITGMTAVTGSIKEPGSYSSGTAMMPSREWRKSAVRFTQLDKMQQRLKKLEKILDERSSS